MTTRPMLFDSPFLLGFDHTRLSYRFQGLDARLTGVLPANVIDGIIT